MDTLKVLRIQLAVRWIK